MGEYAYISTIGQDSHAFAETGEGPIKLCGVDIPFDRAFRANSDGDVALHAITNAISGYTGVNILGGAADKICLEQGIKDSTVYLEEALNADPAYYKEFIEYNPEMITNDVEVMEMIKQKTENGEQKTENGKL